LINFLDNLSRLIFWLFFSPIFLVEMSRANFFFLLFYELLKSWKVFLYYDSLFSFLFIRFLSFRFVLYFIWCRHYFFSIWQFLSHFFSGINFIIQATVDDRLDDDREDESDRLCLCWSLLLLSLRLFVISWYSLSLSHIHTHTHTHTHNQKNINCKSYYILLLVATYQQYRNM
jgi:hypothetical protein